MPEKVALTIPFSNIIYLNNILVIIKRSDMSEGPDVEIQVVYEGGVFKPLQEVDLREGTKAFVALKPGKITSVARK